MKKTLLVLIALFSIVALAACGAKAGQIANFDEIYGDEIAFNRATIENYDLLSNDGAEVTENSPALAASEPTAYQLGDVDNDGIISNGDVLMLFKYVYSPDLYPLDTEEPEYTAFKLGDVNKDGKITNLDILMLFKYIYNPDLYPLEPNEFTDGLEFTLNDTDTEYIVTGYTGTATDIAISATYKGLPVTGVDDYAFYNCTSITSITFSKSSQITSIGTGAFDGCSSLTSITIPEGVTSIGELAFYWCTSLTSITIPEGVTSIGNQAFNGCTVLTSITFNGTIEQWNSITKGSNWNASTGNYTIYCTDGNISK